jgi:hypothetical protein
MLASRRARFCIGPPTRRRMAERASCTISVWSRLHVDCRDDRRAEASCSEAREQHDRDALSEVDVDKVDPFHPRDARNRCDPEQLAEAADGDAGANDRRPSVELLDAWTVRSVRREDDLLEASCGELGRQTFGGPASRQPRRSRWDAGGAGGAVHRAEAKDSHIHSVDSAGRASQARGTLASAWRIEDERAANVRIVGVPLISRSVDRMFSLEPRDVERGQDGSRDAEEPGRERDKDRPCEVLSIGVESAECPGQQSSMIESMVVTTSFTNRPVDRVARVLSPMWRMVSMFPTISITLKIKNGILLQTSSRATKLSESPSVIARTISVIRVPPADTVRRRLERARYGGTPSPYRRTPPPGTTRSAWRRPPPC